jgi:hypothetical protein
MRMLGHVASLQASDGITWMVGVWIGANKTANQVRQHLHGKQWRIGGISPVVCMALGALLCATCMHR